MKLLVVYSQGTQLFVCYANKNLPPFYVIVYHLLLNYGIIYVGEQGVIALLKRFS